MDSSIFPVIFMLAIFSLFLEIMAGGGVFGFLFVLGVLITFPVLGIFPLCLVIVGCIFILLEVFHRARGLYFIIGNMFLVSSTLSVFPFAKVQWFSLILLLSLLIGIFIVSFLFYLSFRKIRSLKHKEDLFSLIGSTGIVGEDSSYAKFQGTQWKIQSETSLHPGEKVYVLELLEDLVLRVSKNQKDS